MDGQTTLSRVRNLKLLPVVGTGALSIARLGMRIMIWKSAMLRLLLVAPLLAAGFALGVPGQASAATSCSTAITGGTIKESLFVPAGEVCTLNGVVVRGGVTVLQGAGLDATNSDIRGAVVADAGPVLVFIRDASVVRGPVTVVGATFAVVVTDSVVRGNLSVTDGVAINLVIENTEVRGSATVSRNGLVSPPPGSIAGNSIAGDLICEGNTGASLGVQNDDVGGVITGQCAQI